MEEELLALDNIQKSFMNIREAAGISADCPTPRIHKFLREWVTELNCSDELIIYALSESANVLSDAGKLLRKWAKAGITTPQQAVEKEKKAIPKEVKKSYETDKVGKNSVLDWAKKFADGEENK